MGEASLQKSTASATAATSAIAPSIGSDDLNKRAAELGLPLLSEAPKKVERSVISFIPEDTARKYKMAVFAKEDGVVRIAMTDPENFEALNMLRFLAEKEQLSIDMYLASLEVVDALFKQYSGTDVALKDAISSLKKDESIGVSFESESTRAAAALDQEVMQDAPIARLVEAIVKHAMDGRASDIHIEPDEEGYRVRFRVDGLLRSTLVFPSQVGRAVVSRIKILSNLKIDEKRKPQDGRFRATQNGKSVDLRVSTLPIVEGEKVVMRVLDKNDNIVDFKKMGLWGRNGEILKKKIMEPFGIILMTGPTGSGKSTTLYSFLQILNQDERNIITLEDPVEYSIAGINQSQVRPEIGYTFASGLRSILRQDPNVIMVGEIRDGETAELAIHAALTGHLVLSTLHTNSAIGSIPRLVDMGIEPFLLASSIEVVAAQRLVRRICLDCRKEDAIPPKLKAQIGEIVEKLPPDEVAKYEVSLSEGVHLYRGGGCDSCGNTGYKGRIAIYETFEATDEVKRIITDERGNEGKLISEARHQGMISIRDDGILKALQGMTTLAEVERVTEGGLLIDED